MAVKPVTLAIFSDTHCGRSHRPWLASCVEVFNQLRQFKITRLLRTSQRSPLTVLQQKASLLSLAPQERDHERQYGAKFVSSPNIPHVLKAVSRTFLWLLGNNISQSARDLFAKIEDTQVCISDGHPRIDLLSQQRRESETALSVQDSGKIASLSIRHRDCRNWLKVGPPRSHDSRAQRTRPRALFGTKQMDLAQRTIASHSSRVATKRCPAKLADDCNPIHLGKTMTYHRTKGALAPSPNAVLVECGRSLKLLVATRTTQLNHGGHSATN